MTSLQPWLTRDVTHAVALAILHFLWQGVALAALASAAMALCRDAAKRYAIAVAVMVLMVAAPALTFIVLQQQAAEHSPVNAIAEIPSLQLPALAAHGAAIANAHFPSRQQSPTPSDALLWLVQAWLTGVVLLSLRPAAGFVAIERLRRHQATPVAGFLQARCLALQQHLGLRRLIQFCECPHLETPAALGWFRPLILLPVSAISGLSVAQLDAVIAHELAHIKRLDAFVNLFQIAAETLLFYHPAVWWLSKRIREERENCCDDVAVAVCGNAAEYAHALASMAEWQAAPNLALAANARPLTARVARILGLAKFPAGVRGASLAANVVCLCASLLAGHALFGNPQAPSASPASAIVPDGTYSFHGHLPTLAQDSSDAVILVTLPRPRTPHNLVTGEPSAPVSDNVAPESSIEITSDQDASTQEKPPATDNSTPPAKSSYIDSLKAAGLANLSADDVIALKIQGVSPEYVRAMIALELHADAAELVGLKIQGITPDYVKALRDSGLKVEADSVLAMKIQGVTPEYAKALRDLGLNVTDEDLVAMKIQGITPDFMRGLLAQGLKVDADEAVAMKIQSITPEYIKGLRELGLKVDVDDVIAMKIQGVSPNYVHDLQALGLQLDDDNVVAMKIQGLTPQYVKGMLATGLKLDADDLISAKIQGITPGFVESVRKHGFKDLDLDKLMQLKNTGVFDQ
ncbi:MAG: M56 family metallopeptidase [Candidatus Acidiferrum sp.]